MVSYFLNDYDYIFMIKEEDGLNFEFAENYPLVASGTVEKLMQMTTNEFYAGCNYHFTSNVLRT